jgi:SAM-dependent methyltransferase
MNWHDRYVQQAQWTRELRGYLFKQAGLAKAGAVLEVGCGTGAVLSALRTPAALHGLDLDAAALVECRRRTANVCLVRGDANRLPYPSGSFDITFCHYLLLWVKEPLKAIREMKRVTKSSRHIIAFAEPDYTARQDQPAPLAVLGKWQTESLRRQGADVGLGGRLAELFHQAGIKIIETGAIQSRGAEALDPEEWAKEWMTLESDLTGIVPAEEILKMKRLGEEARTRGAHVWNVPTYFAWGQV